MQQNPPVPQRVHPRVEVTAEEHGDIQSLQELDHTTTDPNSHYRWVRADPLRIGRRKLKGYRIVHVDEGVKTRAEYLDDTSDGTMRIMDTILMCCPLAPWRKRKRGDLQRSNDRLSAPKKQFKKRARARKAKLTRREMEDE